MKRILLLIFLTPAVIFAQKKPLDHTVYDQWQSVGGLAISNDGKWIAYSVDPQEGDGDLYVISSDRKYSVAVPRGYAVRFTNDNQYAVFKIKPRYQDTREANIKKKKTEEMPKDSLGIIQLGKENVRKFADIKSYAIPEKGFGWIAIQKEPETPKKADKNNKNVDSLKKEIDSLKKIIQQFQPEIPTEKSSDLAVSDTTQSDTSEIAGSALLFLNTRNGKEIEIKKTGAYVLDKAGKNVVVFLKDISKDTLNKNGVLLYSFDKDKGDTILTSVNEAKQFEFSEDGKQLAFVAMIDSNKKALQHYYHLYLHRSGTKNAEKIADQKSVGVPKNYMVSGFGNVGFSKDGSRLFFGTAPVPMPKDTLIKDIDRVKLDVWHYKDDYLQPQQLKNLKVDEEKNYLAVYNIASKKIIQIGDEGLPNVFRPDEGNALYFVATTDTGRRVPLQWTGRTLEDVYSINANTGEKRLIKKNLNGTQYVTPKGKYILWYDNVEKNYFTWNGNKIINISSKISTSLTDEENDMPDYPRQYGVLGWLKDDGAVFIYDRYDVWRIDPEGKNYPINITQDGRINKTVYRYNKTNPDEKFLESGQEMIFNLFNETDKSAQLAKTNLSDQLKFVTISKGDFIFSRPLKAKDDEQIIYTKQNYIQSPDLYLFGRTENKLTAINPQQSDYNWGTAELFHWTTFKGKTSTGIIYKPEDFDSTKRYPAILYFYEKLSDGLNTYIPPTPTPSRLNISFFVSRGYIVLAPDITYTIGHPGESAYDYIVSAAETLAKNKWIDPSNIGIQGQSWGGYQVAYLITRTNLFKAAWSGAPVSDMFSAYGGIRWGSGMNRQFQYEHTQSRIGATIWEKPDLYIENSPLFHLQDVTTPMVIMSNDNDGAVPWYQGIELFTAMRRLNKKVWLLNYNGEEHNLMERKNRKDISIREQQFFDWLLKGEEPTRWIKEGIPAIDKGKDMGLEMD